MRIKAGGSRRTHCKNSFLLKLALMTYISAFTTAADNSTLCTLTDFCFVCGILSLFGVVV